MKLIKAPKHTNSIKIDSFDECLTSANAAALLCQSFRGEDEEEEGEEEEEEEEKKKKKEKRKEKVKKKEPRKTKKT